MKNIFTKRADEKEEIKRLINTIEYCFSNLMLFEKCQENTMIRAEARMKLSKARRRLTELGVY